VTSKFANKPTERRPQAEPGRYQEAMRMCLRCQKGFKSEWVGNRICKRCKEGVNRLGAGTPQWADKHV